MHLFTVVVADYFSAKHLKMINESKILGLVKRQKETGLSITAFCANEGIPKSTYYYWRKKLNREPGKCFIPLLVNNSTQAPMNGPSKYIREQHGHHSSCDNFLLELIYVNGTRLKIKGDPDLDHLRSLVCLLG
jgi:ssDNA-binding Zn-finger/Zn-ribbon topoisomerase 1